MTVHRFIVASMFLALVLCHPSRSFAQATGQDPPTLASSSAPAESLVWLCPGPDATIADLKATVQAAGARVVSLAPERRLLVAVKAGQSVDWAALPGVASAESIQPVPQTIEVPGPYALGALPPDAEEEAHVQAAFVPLQSIAPEPLSLERAELQDLETLPVSVDNSLSRYFPPVGDQGAQGSCTCWAACYYYNTFTQARDEDLTVSNGDPSHICSPGFMYPLINWGNDWGSYTSWAVSRLSEIGCCSWALKPYSDMDYTSWPSEAAWLDALKGRTSTPHVIGSFSGCTDGEMQAIKQYLANGYVAVTQTAVYTNWWSYPYDTTGINNSVLFANDDCLAGYHAVTIVGYDDTRPYFDGTTTQHGAFLVANSWGSGWGSPNTAGTSHGFLWVAYDFFKADNGCFGIAFFNDDRPRYRPQLYAAVGVNHAQRGAVCLRGGVGSYKAPSWLPPNYTLWYDGGTWLGIDDTKRVVVDLTDGVPSINDYDNIRLFVELGIEISAHGNGTITSADFFHDFDVDGIYESASSSDPVVTATNWASAAATVNFAWRDLTNAIHVDDDAPSDPGPGDPTVSDPLANGTSQHPFDSVQKAINAAATGGTILVLQGVYTGPGNRDIDFKGKALTIRSQAPSNPSVVAATIVDCQGSATNRRRGFKFVTDEGPDSVLSGLTIRNGYGPQERYGSSTYSAGGGIYIKNASPTINDCVFDTCQGDYWGGGLHASGSNATILRCTFRNCQEFGGTDGIGGAVYCTGNGPTFRQCVFTANTAPYGAAVYAYGSSPTFANCSFLGNAASNNGGAVRAQGTSAVTLRSCLLAANSAAQQGGAIHSTASSVSAINCTFSGNTAGSLAKALYGGSASTLTVVNTILWDDAPSSGFEAALQGTSQLTVSYSDVRSARTGVSVDASSTLTWGGANITADPRLANPFGSDGNAATWQDNDYHLSAASPCVNRGDTSSAIAFTDTTTAAGTTTTIRVADTSRYQLQDEIEYNGDGVPRTVTTIDSTAKILAFDDPLSWASVSGKTIRNFGWGDAYGQDRFYQGQVDIGADESPYTRTAQASSPIWQSFSMPPQNSSFTAEFDTVPYASPMDGVTGLSSGSATSYANLAAAVRFDPASGRIDVRNGAAYSADTTITYTAGTTYHVRMTVDMGAHRYSVYVTPVGGTEVRLALNYAFRTEQSSVTSLDHWALVAEDGSHDVLSFTAISQAFTDIGAALTGVMACSLAWGDYDNDGKLDLAVAGCHQWDTSVMTRVYHNDGGAFHDIGAALTGVWYCSLVWGDYDSDGDLDLAIAGLDSSRVPITRIYRNDNGTFHDIGAELTGVSMCSLAWGDYDNDGKLDLAVAGSDASNTHIAAIYHNDGNTFHDIGAELTGVSSCCLAWGDYDNDGYLDLAVAGDDGSSPYTGSFVRIYHNSGGTFRDINAGLGKGACSFLAWGDFDNDGDLDLAVAAGWPPGATAVIYRNDGGTFHDLGETLTSADTGSLSWGDFDNDGDLDLALAGDTVTGGHPFTLVYQNNGGTFRDIEAGLLGMCVCSIAWGDQDGDGNLDLAVAGGATSGYVSTIYRNNNPVHNTPPSRPVTPSASISDHSVTFSWFPASDAQTPTAGLSYNLRVGSAPGKDDVVAGMALPTGQRLLPALGNAQKRCSWTLNNVPDGTYYWSVQAIDTAYAGSPWTDEQVLTICTSPGITNTRTGKTYCTIQQAVDAAGPGDEIVLQPGTYTGQGNRDVELRGLPVSVRGTDPDDPSVVAATIINCGGSAVAPHRAFRLDKNEGLDTVLAGLTITGGYAPLEPFGNGSFAAGGAIYCSGASPTIRNCVLRNNTSDYWGGAIWSGGSDVFVEGCIFAENSAGDVGAGIYNNSGSPTVVRCRFTHNTAAAGAGMYNIWQNCYPQVISCLFDGNHATESGGGMRNKQNATPTLINCTFADNTAADGGGIHNADAAVPALSNCILWGNSDSGGMDESAQMTTIGASSIVQYCCIQGLATWTGNGNISSNPNFADSNGADDNPATWADNDYHLAYGSPCVNAGDPSYTSASGDADLDGQPRVLYNRVDMGADELLLVGDIDRDGAVILADLKLLVAAWNSTPTSPNWNPNADIDGDGAVILADLKLLVANWNRSVR